MTPEEIERITVTCEPARRLIKNPDFITTLNALSDYHLAEIVGSSPGGTGRDHREHHHLMLCALKEIHADCMERASRLDALEDELAEANDNSEEDL